jgi:putative heme iron utilization protein
VYGRVEPLAAEMVGVDRYGMDVIATLEGDDKRAVRINFTERTDDTTAVRQQTIALLREARAQLSG